MAGSEGAEGFDMSRVVSRAFGVMGSNPVLFLGLSLIIVGIPNFAFGYWSVTSGPESVTIATEAQEWDPRTESWQRALWSAGIGLGIALIANAVLQAALTRATVVQLSGRSPGLGEALGIGLRLLLPMAIITVLMWLALLFATLAALVPLVLLVSTSTSIVGPPGMVLSAAMALIAMVPAVWLYVIWSAAVPAFVTEKIGIFDAFGRSLQLTRGARGKIFLVLAVIAIATLILTVVAARLEEFAATTTPVAGVVVTSLVAVVVNMIATTIFASSYVELRDVSDGVDPGELETIFA